MTRPTRKPRSLADVFGPEDSTPAPVLDSRPDRLVGVVQQMWESDRDRLKQLGFHERTSARACSNSEWKLGISYL